MLDLLETIRRERGATLVLVTHAPTFALRADRIVRMLDGHAVCEDDGPTSVPERAVDGYVAV